MTVTKGFSGPRNRFPQRKQHGLKVKTEEKAKRLIIDQKFHSIYMCGRTLGARTESGQHNEELSGSAEGAVFYATQWSRGGGRRYSMLLQGARDGGRSSPIGLKLCPLLRSSGAERRWYLKKRRSRPLPHYQKALSHYVRGTL